MARATMSTASVPTQSYIIWFSQRTGSTLFSQALEDTGIAGRPREWFNVGGAAQLLASHHATTAHELRETLWQAGTTSNGVFGVKYGMTADVHAALTTLFADVDSDAPNERAVWESFFPHCRHIFMTRRDKVRLAVSWWRAVKSSEWHRPNRAQTVVNENTPWVPTARPSTAELVEEYDENALRHLFVEANLRETWMQEVFDRWSVVPYTIVYEDFIATYEETVRGAMDFLQLPGREHVAIRPPSFDRLADDVSDAWYERFRRALTPG
jgi:trehalose 2-sulfotransferase